MKAGPHAYISPTWYEAENVVPTWNFTAVHAYGRVQIVEEPDALLEIVREAVLPHERGLPEPWSFNGSGTFVERLLAQIVGFRIEKIEGKFKLNQNHPAERRRKVALALGRRDDDHSQGVAALMRAMLPVEG